MSVETNVFYILSQYYPNTFLISISILDAILITLIMIYESKYKISGNSCINTHFNGNHQIDIYFYKK